MNNALGGVTAVVVGNGAYVLTGVTGLTDAIENGAAVTLQGNGEMDLTGGSERVGSVAGVSATSTLSIGDFSSTAGSFRTGNATSTDYAGIIAGSRATAGAILTKRGGGTWTLTGANTYTGTTLINNGVLRLNRAEQAVGLAAERRARAVGLDRVLAIGDSVRTDLEGANAFGVACLFVTSGIHAAEFGARDNPDDAALADVIGKATRPPLAVTRGLRW